MNVLILRLPKKESLLTSSHCTSCGYSLRWYELIPCISYLILRGKCKNCRESISPMYPLVELGNGFLYMFIFFVKESGNYGNIPDYATFLYCFMASILIVISIIDMKTFEIPIELNISILVIGLIHVGLDYKNFSQYVIGFFVISVLLYILYVVSKGAAIGGGDVKLMAVSGLFLGYKDIFLAFLLGCILASIIHIILMRINKAGRVLAMGPYLSLGIFIAMLYGENIWRWYLSFF